nr:hypothetical protein [Nesterenkonia sp. PF2B19]
MDPRATAAKQLPVPAHLHGRQREQHQGADEDPQCHRRGGGPAGVQQPFGHTAGRPEGDGREQGDEQADGEPA